MPVFVVGTEGFDDGKEEGVLRGGAHGVVGDARWGCSADPGWVGEERVEATVAALGYLYQYYCDNQVRMVKGRRAGPRACRQSIEEGNHIHHPDQCRYHQSVPEQNI